MACVDAKLQPAPASACLGLTAPAASRACNTAPCVGHTWQVRRLPVRPKTVRNVHLMQRISVARAFSRMPCLGLSHEVEAFSRLGR